MTCELDSRAGLRAALSLAIDCARLLAEHTERAAQDYDAVARQCRNLLAAHGLYVLEPAAVDRDGLPVATPALVARLQRTLGEAIARAREALPESTARAFERQIDVLFETAAEAADRALVDGVHRPVRREGDR